jgi:RNA polymerase sigma-70 factor, ECF subfamily
MPDDLDDRLLAQAREGNRRSLEQLLERHQAQIYRFGLQMCRDPEDAKDVLQETLLALARGVRTFRGASSLSTWLYTVARSYCLKKRRRRKDAPAESARTDLESAAAIEDSAHRPDEALAERQTREALAHAIAALEPKYREVLLLRDVEGLTAPEVATVVGASVQAVKSRLHRARLSVRERVAPLLGVPLGPAVRAPGCADVPALFSRYLEDELNPEICARMERHLATCADCRGACDSLKRTLALCRASAPAVPVPAQVQASVRVALRQFLSQNP